MKRHLILMCAGAVACGAARVQQAGSSFDGRRAYDHVRALVAVGARPSGSPGAERTRTYIKGQLEALGLHPEEQAFDARTPLGIVRMVNLRATLPASSATSTPRLLIAGHYDTKLFKDLLFVGANDGGSSTALLLELARALKGQSLRLPVELLFFDGEEAVIEWNSDTDSTYGSRYYVDAARRDGTLERIGALVLVDMIGDRDLRILRESNSTPWLTDTIWSAARRQNRREFVDEMIAIEDDHLPFLKAGVPAVDIIDLDYSAWHTAEDTLDRVSPQSLQTVGDVLLEALPELIERIARQR